MDPLRYRDTRDRDSRRPTFSEVVLTGIAAGGGLYVPESLPRLTLEEIVGLADLPYHERAARVFAAFRVDLPPGRMEDLLAEAYGPAFDDPEVAPLRRVSGTAHVLELWHGPTAAFKDMALQVLPRVFAEAAGRRDDPLRHLVLVATSGDTGKAALEGFAGRPDLGIVVFYPAGGVSELQRLQMVTQAGDNVAVYGVEGNFDDCQTAVKAAFGDAAFAAELAESHEVALSSANSINWGRLLPQVVYYLSAYADLVASGGVEPGEPVDFAVPTGNFGNILAAYYAGRLGLPLGRLLCASNENRVLADFLASGTYDLAGRAFVTTPSPSMDILISSNLERALYEVSGAPSRVAHWMDELRRTARFTVDPDTFAALGERFQGDWVTNEESLETIRQVWEETGYLLDPHTAVAWRVGERYVSERPLIVVGTAHWAKFGLDVYRALQQIPAGAPLPPEIVVLTPGEVLEQVVELAPGASVPESLGRLDGLPVRFGETIPGTADAVMAAVRRFLTGF